MRVLDIFYIRFFSENGNKMSIGGIETYIANLINLADKMSIGVRVFQYANHDFETRYKSAIVYGIKREKKDYKKKFESLYSKAVSTRNEGCLYINVIANDTLIPDWKVPNSIVIQHGIGFDSPSEKEESFFLSFMQRARSSYYMLKKFRNIDAAVCVDNNFISWFRTQTPLRFLKMIPILNFTRIGDEVVEKSKDPIKIVFSRRFVKLRGTGLFAPVAKRLLSEFGNIEITFAGEGPEEQWLKSLFQNEPRVSFTKYAPDESVEFHQQFNIAVVPTIYSEGTSLSLLEAMSAHCAVVCTNIGGMTNIVLDKFNGLMISPDEEELFRAISLLIEDANFRDDIANNAYETVKASFSVEKWQDDWEAVINDKFNMICQK
jgi:glycosyltransferase involved in cell wall biosynthesis